MAAIKGSRAKGNKRSGRNPGRGGASRWTRRVHRGLRILQVPELAKLSWLVHGFSARVGGVSKLDGKRVLNLGFTEWDKRENVKENRRRLQAAVGAQDLKLVSLLQFHSDGVVHLETAPTEPARGDASVTKRAGLLLAVQTADCVPILLVDPKNRAVAAVHAGWRGTLARIVEKTIGRMQMQFGSKAEDLLAAIGPAIGGCCYEVGTEVAGADRGEFANAGGFFYALGRAVDVCGGDIEERELAAGGHYVAAAGVADEGWDAAVDENFAEDFDVAGGGFAVGELAGIPRDQVHLDGFQVGEETHDAAGVFGRIIDAAQHHVFEGQMLPGAERVVAASFEESGERIFAVYGHNRVALLVARSVEGDSQLGADFFLAQALDAW